MTATAHSLAACSVVDEPSLGRDLLDQVELVTVRGQHRQPRLCGGKQDQSIVEALLALGRLVALRPRQRSRDQPRLDPDVRGQA